MLVAHYLHSTEISFMHLNAKTASGHNETIYPVFLSQSFIGRPGTSIHCGQNWKFVQSSVISEDPINRKLERGIISTAPSI